MSKKRTRGAKMKKIKRAKKTYEQIVQTVPVTIESPRGITTFKDMMLPFFFSKGIEAMIEDYGTVGYKCVYDALYRLLVDDFGNAEKTDSFGCYPSPLGDTPETGAILIRMDAGIMTFGHIIVYLKFEK